MVRKLALYSFLLDVFSEIDTDPHAVVRGNIERSYLYTSQLLSMVTFLKYNISSQPEY